MSSLVVIDLIPLEAPGFDFDSFVPTLHFFSIPAGPFASQEDWYAFLHIPDSAGIHALTHAVRSKQPEIQAMLPQINLEPSPL